MTNELTTEFVLYHSTATGQGCADCHDILREARARNARLHLTGYLHQEDGRYYQWLEGPAAELAEVMALILSDPRHRDVHYLRSGAQAERKFGGWAMCFGLTSAGSFFDWVAEYGTSLRSEEKFADALLKFMLSDAVRQSARA
ncbi:BLUF domain-containing protein [Paracoccus pacificus]|uniref:BLUF domain-containing protein n=1 Tax=Paracoccus pacificus TaxID=1463598 RepID=A0ABW4R519_9RHOB